MFWRIPLFLVALLITGAFASSCAVEFRDNDDEPAARVRVGGGEDDDSLEERGYDKIGTRTVDYGAGLDHDTIYVTFLQGRFSRIIIKVTESDLDMYDVAVTLGDGEVFYPRVRYFFAEGSRTHSIDLPGGERVIQKVEFWYKNTPGGGRAEVELWAK
ncbi:MAG: hypothetical protein IT462_17365 [Planctomycetes bacterium]|nr:hypothetical protein [Planctomycetota bacterium]